MGLPGLDNRCAMIRVVSLIFHCNYILRLVLGLQQEDGFSMHKGGSGCKFSVQHMARTANVRIVFLVEGLTPGFYIPGRLIYIQQVGTRYLPK